MAFLSFFVPRAAEVPGAEADGGDILYFSEKHRLQGFLRTAHGICEELYTRGSVGGRRVRADATLLVPEVNRVLMEQAWFEFRDRHGPFMPRLGFSHRRRADLARAGLLGVGWRRQVQALEQARSGFVEKGELGDFVALSGFVNELFDRLMRVASPDRALGDLRELVRDAGEVATLGRRG